MNHGRSPGDPLAALERSLRDGPPDESGYRAEAVDFETASRSTTSLDSVGARDTDGSVRLVRRPRSDSHWFSLAGAVALALVIVVGGFAILQQLGRNGAGQPGSPSLRPGTSPSASPVPVPPLTKTFVSTRNGFSVAYPAGWATKSATTSWKPNGFVPWGNSALDELQSPGEARLVVASQLLAPGQTAEAWLASFFQPYPWAAACSTEQSTWPRLPIDGQYGYVDIAGCPVPADVKFSRPDIEFDVIVFAGRRVYEITMDGVIDRAYFEAFLGTVRLDPASAMDPPPPS